MENEEALVAAQNAFAADVARLILRAAGLGIGISIDEAYRPPEVAKLYADQGRGIANSLHCDKLAVDLNAFRDGKLLTTQEGYEPLGVFWKGLHPLNRWGGDFARRDYRHFSRSRGGRA